MEGKALKFSFVKPCQKYGYLEILKFIHPLKWKKKMMEPCSGIGFQFRGRSTNLEMSRLVSSCISSCAIVFILWCYYCFVTFKIHLSFWWVPGNKIFNVRSVPSSIIGSKLSMLQGRITSILPHASFSSVHSARPMELSEMPSQHLSLPDLSWSCHSVSSGHIVWYARWRQSDRRNKAKRLCLFPAG